MSYEVNYDVKRTSGWSDMLVSELERGGGGGGGGVEREAEQMELYTRRGIRGGVIV